MRGFTLIELIVTVAVIAIVASIGLPMGKTMMDSYRVEATIEDMKVVAAAGDVVRQLPSGNTLNKVQTTVIGNRLNARDINTIGISATTPMRSHWGTPYLVTTTNKRALVEVTIPIAGMNPFQVKASPSGGGTLLQLEHQPLGMHHAELAGIKAKKKLLYLE